MRSKNIKALTNLPFRPSPKSGGVTASEALLIRGGDGRSTGGEEPPHNPEVREWGPAMLLALIAGREALSDGTIGVTVTASEFTLNVSFPYLLLLAILVALSSRHWLK